MNYTTEQVIEALKVFSSRNQVRPPEDTKFEAYQVLDWHIRQLQAGIIIQQTLPSVYESVLDRISLILKSNNRFWGYSGTDERFSIPDAIIHVFEEMSYLKQQLKTKENNGI